MTGPANVNPPACLVVCEATGGCEAALPNAVLRAAHASHRADALLPEPAQSIDARSPVSPA